MRACAQGQRPRESNNAKPRKVRFHQELLSPRQWLNGDRFNAGGLLATVSSYVYHCCCTAPRAQSYHQLTELKRREVSDDPPKGEGEAGEQPKPSGPYSPWRAPDVPGLLQMSQTYSRTDPHYLEIQKREKWWRGGGILKVRLQLADSCPVREGLHRDSRIPTSRSFYSITGSKLTVWCICCCFSITSGLETALLVCRCLTPSRLKM